MAARLQLEHMRGGPRPALPPGAMPGLSMGQPPSGENVRGTGQYL